MQSARLVHSGQLSRKNALNCSKAIELHASSIELLRNEIPKRYPWSKLQGVITLSGPMYALNLAPSQVSIASGMTF